MEIPSPGSSGQLVDPSGNLWTVHRKRLDLRKVRSMLRRADIPVLLGESAGFDLRWIEQQEMPTLWEQIRKNYGRLAVGSDVEYVGYEFTNPEGDRLLYIEVWC